MTDTAGHLHDLGAELRESHHCWPGNDRHLGLQDLVFLRTLRALTQFKLSIILVSILVHGLARVRVNNGQLLVEREELGVALAIHEELGGILLEA